MGHWTRSADATDTMSFDVFEDQRSAERFLEVVKSDPQDVASKASRTGSWSSREVLVTVEYWSNKLLNRIAPRSWPGELVFQGR